MRDAALCLLDALGDLAADTDHTVLLHGFLAGWRFAGAALQEGVEIRVRDPSRRTGTPEVLELDAELAGALAHSGSGERMDARQRFRRVPLGRRWQRARRLRGSRRLPAGGCVGFCLDDRELGADADLLAYRAVDRNDNAGGGR